MSYTGILVNDGDRGPTATMNDMEESLSYDTEGKTGARRGSTCYNSVAVTSHKMGWP